MSQIYAKDSFDRFGDDLCEVLLSYLSFKERFRYECVSKQWQRVVYNTQMQLIIDKKLCKHMFNKNIIYVKQSSGSYIATNTGNKGLQLFETIVNKCANIKHINLFQYDMRLTNELLKIVPKYYDHLNALIVYAESYGVNGIDLDNFLTNYGKQLQTIAFIDRRRELNETYLTPMLQMCENMFCIMITSNIAKDSLFWRLFCVENEIHFKKLNAIGLTLKEELYGKPKIQSIEPFVRNYGQKLRSFDLIFDFSDKDLMSDIMKSLSQMHALIHLRIDFKYRFEDTYHTFIDDLTQIGVNCRQLKKLILRDIRLKVSLDTIIDTINRSFGSHIRRLEIRGHFGSSVACNARLNACKRLTHLTLLCSGGYSESELSFDPFVPNIVTDLPQLRYLCLPSTVLRYETEVNVLSRLTRLHMFRAKCYENLEMFNQLLNPYNRVMNVNSVGRRMNHNEIFMNAIRNSCPKMTKVYIEVIYDYYDEPTNCGDIDDYANY